ncbi:MAG: PKD domain-containing protein [Salibacteraceae bacterium]
MTHKLPIIIILAIVTLALSACKKKEVSAAFDVNQSRTTDIDFKFEFSNLSENTTIYEWDFGDGTTSSVINPKHTYTEKGAYIVQLTSANEDGDFDVFEYPIIIGDWFMTFFDIDYSEFVPSNIEVESDGPFSCDGLDESELIGFLFAGGNWPLSSLPYSGKVFYGSTLGESVGASFNDCVRNVDISSRAVFFRSTGLLGVNGQSISVPPLSGTIFLSDIFDENISHNCNFDAIPVTNDGIIVDGDEGFVKVNFTLEVL